MPTHWKKLTNPNYIGAYAFDEGEEKVGTIDYVKQESVKSTEGKEEECIVCHFKERDMKPLVLNKSNCKTITKLYNTPYIEDWAGKKIVLYVTQVKAFGDVVDAVRIRNKVPTDKAKAIKCESCGNVIKGVGQYDAAFVANKNKQRYGKCLCVDCGKKAQAEMDAKKNDESDKHASEHTASEPAEAEATVNESGEDLAAQLIASAGGRKEE